MPTSILDLPLAEVDQETGQFEDWLYTLTFLQADEVTPIDLTGLRFTFSVRHKNEDAAALLVGTTDNGRLVNGGSNGQLSFAVPAESMQDVPAGTHVYDVRASGDGYMRRVVTGTLIVVQGIDRSEHWGAPGTT